MDGDGGLDGVHKGFRIYSGKQTLFFCLAAPTALTISTNPG